MVKSHVAVLVVLLASSALLSCSDDTSSGDTADTGSDTLGDAADADRAPDADEDVITIGEVGSPDQGAGCDPRLLAGAWPWNDAVTTGTVDVSEDAGVFSATIDASAGGIDHSRLLPFVYLDLESGARVDLTDLEALEDASWDLAFKRVLIRTNSADSGPGQISLARVTGTPFADVTTAPTDPAAYATDVTLDENCELLTDPIGNPFAAINYINQDNQSGSSSWYNYDGGVSPNPGDVYIIRNDATDTTYKLEILSWSNGVFELQWAEL